MNLPKLVNKQLKYRSRPDLSISSSNGFENISIELKTSIAEVIVSSIYRPPNTNQRKFIECIENLGNKIEKENKKEWIIGLDHNMDFIKSESNTNTGLFIDKLLELELYPLITRPTRITKNMATLIDNILVSHSLYNKSSVR